MFGKKKGNNQGISSPTLISEGVEVVGDIHFKGSVEIMGTVSGDIVSEEESARVRILNGGSVRGDIRVASVIINGHVKGDIYASNQIKIAAQAMVEGNIYYHLIEIEKGAEIAGNFVYERSQTNISTFPADEKLQSGAQPTKNS